MGRCSVEAAGHAVRLETQNEAAGDQCFGVALQVASNLRWRHQKRPQDQEHIFHDPPVRFENLVDFIFVGRRHEPRTHGPIDAQSRTKEDDDLRHGLEELYQVDPGGGVRNGRTKV